MEVMTMELGSNIKSLRLSMGKTQEEIAKSAGFEQSLYAKWEADKSLPGAENLVKLANVFNCSIDYLLGREQEDGLIVIDNSSNAISDIEQHILDIFRALTNRNKIKVVGYVDGIYAGQQQGA